MASDLQYFDYEHLDDSFMRLVSKRFHDLAHELDRDLPEGTQKQLGLQQLLVAKDCAVRAAMPKPASQFERRVVVDSPQA